MKIIKLINITDIILPIGFFEEKRGCISLLGALIVFLAFLAPPTSAGCGCGSGAIGNWDPTGFLNSELGSSQVGSSQTTASSASATEPVDRIDTFPNNDILISEKKDHGYAG